MQAESSTAANEAHSAGPGEGSAESAPRRTTRRAGTTRRDGSAESTESTARPRRTSANQGRGAARTRKAPGEGQDGVAAARVAAAPGQTASEAKAVTRASAGSEATDGEARQIIPRAQTRSLERGLRALEYVAQVGEAGVGDVAEALELPRASAHILLSTMTQAGYLRQVRRRGRYRLDLRVVALARAALSQMPVRERAAPLLHELAENTGLPVYLAVLSRGEAMTIDRVVPKPRPESRADLGTTNPAYASSLGKALLAFLPPEELEEYLSTVQLEARTNQTIQSVEQLREELEHIRQVGYATSEGEHRPGVRSISAPIYSYEGDAVASVCVRHYTPSDQPPPENLIRQTIEVAQRISYSLGYGVKPD